MATGRSIPSSRGHAAAEKAAEHILRTLREHGHTSYLAGGCVRDTLLGLSPSDFDVATGARPDEVLELFEDSHAVGKAFGVVLVRFGHGKLGEIAGRPSPGVSVEVATFRREGEYSDKRRPDSVVFSGPEDDAKRRDFTINALFLDPLKPGSMEQQVIDLVGGLDDLREGVIRAVGEPSARLNEDHLRALRAVRFAARLNFSIEVETAKAIRQHTQELAGVSPERVGDELRRMLGSEASLPARRRAIGLLEEFGLADQVLSPEPHTSAPGIAWFGVDNIAAQTPFAIALLAWLHDRAGLSGLDGTKAADLLLARADALRRALVLSNEEIRAFRDAASGLAVLEEQWNAASIAQKKRWAASEWFLGSSLLLKARKPLSASEIQQEWKTLASDGIGLSPDPWVTGEELIRSGLTPGPGFKDRLDRAYDAQLDGRAKTPTEALEIALGTVG